MNLARMVMDLLGRIEADEIVERLRAKGRTQVRRMAGDGRPPVGVIVLVGEEGGADGVAVIGGRGEDVQVLERRALPDQPIERGIEGAAATENEIVGDAELGEVVQQLGHRLLEDQLAGAGQVGRAAVG